MNRFFHNLRHAGRVLTKNPGFTTVVVLTLALGIGANTAVFSILNAVLFRALPFEDPSRLVVVWETFRQRQDGSVSYPNLADWRARNVVFEQMAGFRTNDHTITGFDTPERVSGARVTSNFFTTLGVAPALGRAFQPEDDQAGAADVVILSDGLWRRLFGADRNVVGQTVTLDGVASTIVGVLPPDFDFPLRLSGTEIWTPAAHDATAQTQRGWPMLTVAARLRPGATLEQAQAQMNTIQDWLASEYPQTSENHGIRVVPMHEEVVGHVRPFLLTLLGAASLVLLIACANVANLLLARGTGRGKELAVRASLGAGRAHLIGQMLVETLVLSVVGGALGVLLAFWAIDVLVAAMPERIPRTHDIRIDGWVLAFTLAISVLTSLLAGLVPAWRSSRFDLTATLKEGHVNPTGAAGSRLRSSLVVAQVALTVVLLVATGLMLRSFSLLTRVAPGFEPDGLLTFQLDLGWQHRSTTADRAALYDRMLERLAALPNVESVSASSTLPMSRLEGFPFNVVGRPTPELMADWPRSRYGSISPEYFRTMGIPLLRGRQLTELDKRSNRPGAIVINQALARRYFPDEDPIGQRIRSVIDIEHSDPHEFEIVGIVSDVHARGLDIEQAPCIYAPYHQQTFPYMFFALRTTGDPRSLINTVRAAAAEVTDSEAINRMMTMNDVLRSSRGVTERRFPMVLLTTFGGLALILTLVGVYGMLSYTVARRTHEIGVRMALGARAADVTRLVVGQSLMITAIGAAIGIAAAFAATRLMASWLFGVAPTDPGTFTVVPLALMAAALLASYLPARRATKVDPMVALRCE